MHAVLWTVVGLLVQEASKATPPPAPDFKTEIDYKAWLEKYAVGEFSAEQNGAAIYAAIFGASSDATAKKMGFDGPWTGEKPVERIEPWDPAKHPAWEAAFQKTKQVVQRFSEAATKPYAWGGLRFDTAPGEPKLLVFSVLNDLSSMRTLAKGALENAWRAPGGKIDEAAFLASTRSVLGQIRQIERNPHLISALVGTAIRASCYVHLLRAAELEILSEKARADILRTLKSRDEGAPPFEFAANCELAAIFDAIQYVVMKNNGVFGVNEQTGIGLKGGFRCNGPRARDSASAHFALLVSESSKPYDAGTMDRITAADEEVKKGEKLAAIVCPELGRAYQLQLRGEALRRGTRLVYEMLVYHDKSGKWPTKLADLPLEADIRMRIDPFSNQPFAYRLDDGKPLLYSWGQNAKDDGGTTHDSRWGDKVENADFIIWPVQP